MRNLFYLAISLILIACASQNSEKLPSGTAANPASQRLTVFAAASLADAFSEIGEAYTAQHPTVKIDFNFGGSQQLAQQLLEGAPADLFASANQQQMELLLQNGSITQSAIRIFVQNRLILALAPGNPGKINSLQDLVTPGLNVVLAAEDVPAGRYTLEFLERTSQADGFGAGYKDQVLANVVSYEENVRSVLTKVILGEADAGIVYESDLAGKDAQNSGRITIPESYNVIAQYPIAPMADSPNASQAEAFIDFVLSPAGQAILEKFGFLPIDQ